MIESLSNVTLGDVAKWLAAIIALVSGVIQLSPIKVNPWSWIGRQIGKAINGEVLTEVENIKKEVAGVKDDVAKMQAISDERNAKSARTRILRFGDEILHGVKHSKDHFDEILSACTEYDEYCRNHQDFKNHMTERTESLITKTYDKCMEENDFL